jgi:hypothetical protein
MSEQFTPEQLAEIEEFGTLLFEPNEVAIILGIDTEAFHHELGDPESEVYKAYFRGFLKSKAELRKSIIRFAKQGSVPAQNVMIKMIEEIELNQLK